jgi:hypothetical protein
MNLYQKCKEKGIEGQEGILVIGTTEKWPHQEIMMITANSLPNHPNESAKAYGLVKVHDFLFKRHDSWAATAREKRETTLFLDAPNHLSFRS